uniref:BLTX535 n=1 Tax=Nephila pilipes TaxID=299642 RepID=A0A076KV21_NEPPI|nr:BLTX535 [Nephila pilipes]
MSKTLVRLTETVPFYTQDLCKDSPFGYNSFSANSSATNNCLKLEESDPISNLQDENHYVNNCPIGNNTSKSTLPRKREASNILMESVKRRDNLRNIGDSTPNVPYDSLNCDPAFVTRNAENSVLSEKVCIIQTESFNFDSSINVDLSDSSVTDSGIESSKNNSPTHSIDTSSTYCLDDDVCQDLMEIDDGISVLKSEKKDTQIVPQIEDGPKLVEFSAADLDGLHLTDAVSTLSDIKAEIANAKPPFIQSLFKNVPSVICFSPKMK